jgi:hypothetical protein
LSPLTAGEAFQATISRQKKLEAAGYKVGFVMLHWMVVYMIDDSIVLRKYILGALHLGV